MRALVEIRKEFQPPWVPGAKANNLRENLDRASRGERPGKWKGPIARRVDRAKDYAKREATAQARVAQQDLAEAIRTEGRKVAGKAAIGTAIGGGALLATTAGAAAVGSSAAAKRAAARSTRANKRLAAVVVPSTALAAGGGTLVASRADTRRPDR